MRRHLVRRSRSLLNELARRVKPLEPADHHGHIAPHRLPVGGEGLTVRPAQNGLAKPRLSPRRPDLQHGSRTAEDGTKGVVHRTIPAIGIRLPWPKQMLPTTRLLAPWELCPAYGPESHPILQPQAPRSRSLLVLANSPSYTPDTTICHHLSPWARNAQGNPPGGLAAPPEEHWRVAARRPRAGRPWHGGRVGHRGRERAMAGCGPATAGRPVPSPDPNGHSTRLGFGRGGPYNGGIVFWPESRRSPLTKQTPS